VISGNTVYSVVKYLTSKYVFNIKCKFGTGGTEVGIKAGNVN